MDPYSMKPYKVPFSGHVGSQNEVAWLTRRAPMTLDIQPTGTFPGWTYNAFSGTI